MDLPVNYDELPIHMKRVVREEYARIQGGRCCHCGEPLNGEPSKEVRDKWVNRKLFPPGFFKWPVHLHHDHNTGMTIGAVHNYCNAVLWQFYGE